MRNGDDFSPFRLLGQFLAFTETNKQQGEGRGMDPAEEQDKTKFGANKAADRRWNFQNKDIVLNGILSTEL